MTGIVGSFAGRLTEDVYTLREPDTGLAMATFRMRIEDDDVSRPRLALVAVIGTLAEHLVHQLVRGCRVRVEGRLRFRAFPVSERHGRPHVEMHAAAVEILPPPRRVRSARNAHR